LNAYFYQTYEGIGTARILETDIPLLSSFLDIFCHQYIYIDHKNAQAWRAVWEEWQAIDPQTAPASPCLVDFIVYDIGRQYCKDMVGHYQCQMGQHDFYHFGSRLRSRNCLVCHAQRPRRRHAATLTDYMLPCQIPHDRLPCNAEGNLLLDSNNLLYKFDGLRGQLPANPVGFLRHHDALAQRRRAHCRRAAARAATSDENVTTSLAHDDFWTIRESTRIFANIRVDSREFVDDFHLFLLCFFGSAIR
jgi:hypothetical protein